MMELARPPSKILKSDLAVVEKRGWLASCSKGFREELLGHSMVRNIAEGQAIYLHGDEPDGLYAIVSGAIKISVPADDGQEFMAHHDGAGFWVGDLAMLSEQTRLVSVWASISTRALFIPSRRILSMVEQTPEHYREFYSLSHENMRTVLRIMANLATGRTDQRLALRLLHLDETNARTGDWLTLSQDELAAMVAISVPTLQRVLRAYADQGLVELGYSRIRINDRAALFTRCQT